MIAQPDMPRRSRDHPQVTGRITPLTAIAACVTRSACSVERAGRQRACGDSRLRAPLRNLQAVCIETMSSGSLMRMVVSPFACGACLSGRRREKNSACGVHRYRRRHHRALPCSLTASLCYTDIIPVGGNHITNDIARGLSTPFGARRADENSLWHLRCRAASDER